MENRRKKKYYVVKERAVPEVLLKVVEAKKLLDSGKVQTVQEAAERMDISRSSFYKYKMIFFLSMRKPEERQSHLLFRWMTSRDFYQWCLEQSHAFMEYSYNSSKYSNQRSCHTYFKCGYSSG